MSIQNSLVYQLMATFNKSERAKFNRFLNSPFFNQNEILIRLAEFLFQVSPPSKEEIWKALEMKNSYDDDRFRKMVTKIYSLSKEFVVFQSLELDENGQNILLLKSLSRRNLDRHFNKELKVAEKKLEDQSLRDDTYFLHRSEIDEIYECHRAKVKDRTEREPRLDSLYQNYLYFFMYRKSHLEALIRTRNHTLTGRPIPIEPEAVDIPIAVEMMNSFNALIEKFDLEEWESLLGQLKSNLNLISYNHQWDLFSGLQNTLAANINGENADDSYHRLFKLYRFGLEHILFEEPQLPPFFYKNIAEVSLLVDQPDFCYDFIQTHVHKIGPKFQEAAYSLCLARYHFYLEEYRKCLQLLYPIHIRDVFLRLSARLLRLKCLYQLPDEHDRLESEIPAFKEFLRRNTRIPEITARNYMYRVNLISKLHKANSKPQLKALLEELQSKDKPLPDQKWLIKETQAKLRHGKVHSW